MAWPYHCFPRDAGGNRTHLNRVAAGRLAVWLQRHVVSVSSPGVEPGLRPPQGRVRIPHTSRTYLPSAPPRNRTSSGSFEDCRAVRHTRRANVSTRNRTWIRTFGGSYAIPCTIETLSVPTWSRTRARALGEPRAIRYTIGTHTRADDWTCTSIKRFTGPLPFCSATSAFQGTSARSRTPCDGFGDRLLSQEHARVSAPGRAAESRRNDYFCNSTFQYASLMNFDQLSIRTWWSA